MIGWIVSKRKHRDARRPGKLFTIASIAALPFQIGMTILDQRRMIARIQNDPSFRNQIINEVNATRREIKSLESRRVLTKEEKQWLLQSKANYTGKLRLLKKAGVKI